MITSIINYATDLEQNTLDHINSLSILPVWKNKIAIMPDAHDGKGAVIGFTAYCDLSKGIIPNVVGVDIGCGVIAHRLPIKKDKLNLEGIDRDIRSVIPMGFNSQPIFSESMLAWFDNIPDTFLQILGKEYGDNYVNRLLGDCHYIHIKNDAPILNQLGTLGGGNHFIEMGIDDNENIYLLIHSGSRNFGLQVANFHQNIAKNIHKSMNTGVNPEQTWLPCSLLGEELAREYIEDMQLCQKWASLNRKIILLTILDKLGVLDLYNIDSSIESVHNYIELRDKDVIVRKGAISAYKDQKVVIPINMADGTIIATGKGNSDWNFSAPHGAGRVMGRKQALRELSSDKLNEIMNNKGVLNTNLETCLDESPEAYRRIEDILPTISPTVEVEGIIKPLLSIKA